MQEEIKIIIVEDEEMWLKSISVSLFDFGYTIAGTASSFESAVSLFSGVEFDIALLDIHLGADNKGLELGKMLSAYYKKPFIYITAEAGRHSLQEAVSTKPSAYLTKPVHPSSLAGAIQLAINTAYHFAEPENNTDLSQSTVFFVKQGNKYKKIDWTKVVYLKSDKNYTAIYHEPDKTEYFIRSTLSKTLNFIIPSSLRASFVQVNRAEAAQTGYITEIAADEVKTAYKSFVLTEVFAASLKKAIQIVV